MHTFEFQQIHYFPMSITGDQFARERNVGRTWNDELDDIERFDSLRQIDENEYKENAIDGFVRAMT